MLKINLLIGFLLFGFLFIVPKNSRILKDKTEKITIVGDTISWKLLGQVKFVKKPHKEYGEVDFPIVNTTLKSLNTKKIYISGFIVPIDNKNYAISKNVFASCFFCGKAGPETIMGLNFKDNLPKLKTDQYVTIEGTLRLNDSNIDNWMYNVDNVKIIKGN